MMVQKKMKMVLCMNILFDCEMNQVILKYPNTEHEWYESSKWIKN